MSSFWGKIGEKLNIIVQWSYDNHPGKLIGALTGFFLALLIVIFGFWQTILLFGLTALGYFLGKCWDDREIPPWLNKLIHRISFWGKN